MRHERQKAKAVDSKRVTATMMPRWVGRASHIHRRGIAHLHPANAASGMSARSGAPPIRAVTMSAVRWSCARA